MFLISKLPVKVDLGLFCLMALSLLYPSLSFEILSEQMEYFRIALLQRDIFRSFLTLFKYCNLCNNRIWHPLILRQVLCKAFSITKLSTLEVMSVLDMLLWNQTPYNP